MSDKIEKLNDYQHARRRTEMYLSSRDPHTQVVLNYVDSAPIPTETTWVPAVFTAFREVLDNALDEVITKGYGNQIDVKYDPVNMIFTVTDNGRGIPIDFDKTHNQYLATLALSETKAGRNFADKRGKTRGLNGVGASIVNFCSEYFSVDIIRDGMNFKQMFKEGDKNDDLTIENPIILPCNNKTTGTSISFKLSKKVFKNMILPEDFIKSRIFEISLIYPKLKVSYNGKLLSNKKPIEKVLFPNKKPIKFVIEDEGFLSTFLLMPEFFDDGSEYIHSMVNGIPVFNGGTHVESFRRTFYKGVLTALERESKRRKLQPNTADLSDGMLIYNVTEMDDPSFDSQSKSRLINESVTNIIKNQVDTPEFFKKVVKDNPEWIESIYDRCQERTNKKDNKDAEKLAKKNLRTKIQDLDDACSRQRNKCILFLGEGKSAISGMVEARDPEIHGGLPLRGKVLNVHDETPKSVLENQALSNIMNAVGLIPGKRVKRGELRYGKIYITTDADEDGKNIAALLINFFYKFWPELFDPDQEPFIYVFETPLIIAAKGKQKKYWYADSYHEFSADVYSGWDITRAKGLAALKRDDWKHVLNEPKLIEIIDEFRVENDKKISVLEESLDLLFNKSRAADRKEWIGM